MRPPKLLRPIRARWALLFVYTFAVVGVVRAQGLPGFSQEMQEALQKAAQQGSLQDVLSGEAVPLEGALDPTEYIVGPGDVFEVSVGTAIPTLLNLTVSADGLLVVPSTGSYEVADLTLDAARDRVLAGLRRAYRNVDADVALARPRQFYVHVAGTVPQPGRHVVAPVARVEDALAAAMGGTSPVLVLRELRAAAPYANEPLYLPALRGIEIRRRDGSTEPVDLWRYYTSGDLEYNPYVRDGDALFVPAFRDDIGAVSVSGEVPNPGTYDYRDGDTALALLHIAVGAADLSTVGDVRIIRSSDGTALTLNAEDLAAGRAADPALTPGDHLVIAPKDRKSGTAQAAGYVSYPGSYPIQSGVTTLQDLLEMAGGLRDDALLRGAYLERLGSARSATYEPGQPTPFRAVPMTSEIDPRAIELALESEVSMLARNSDLGYAGQQFYGRELLQPQRVSIDVSAALSGSSSPVLLQDGDRLVVPRDPNAVLVVGQVGRPGYIPFRTGLSAKDYIKLAGDVGSAAAGVYVRDAATGRVRPANRDALGSGDYVFVDRVGVGDTPETQSLVIQERNLTAQRNNRYFQLATAAITSAATIITILITRQ